MLWWIYHRVTDEIQLGCYFDNLGEYIFYMQISAANIETPILFNIIISLHDTLIKMEYAKAVLQVQVKGFSYVNVLQPFCVKSRLPLLSSFILT